MFPAYRGTSAQAAAAPALWVWLLVPPLARTAPDSPANLIPNGSFEGGSGAATRAGWRIHEHVAVEKGAAAEGEWYVSIKPIKNTAAPNYVRLTDISVRPNTGYVARCRLRLPHASAHHTFAILNPDGSYFVSRDAYAGSRPAWAESRLPFRTRDQTRIGIHLGRRYGRGEIWYDAVELVEDDTVRIGDVSPRPNPFPTPTRAEERRGYIISRRHWMTSVCGTEVNR